MFDSHIHLDQYPDTELDADLAAWQEAGIAGVIAVATDLASAYRTLALRQRYPDFVYAALGLHPEQPLPSPAEIDELIGLLYKERSMLHAIGEVGLPHYVPEAVQQMDAHKACLHRFAAAAVDLDVPLVLHAVHDKAAQALAVLRSCGVRRAHFHWLKAPDAVVDDIVRHGYFISVTPEVCYRTRDQELVRRVPQAQLLLETDGPWPYNGPFAGQKTTPLLLRQTAAAVADLYGVQIEQTAAESLHATQKLYGLFD
ncbi:TatD family hydrolase [Aneurinibacillus sp. BA2021]|nr:TatD family hydrolase [Aneurinibacillus sp. BA2021]